MFILFYTFAFFLVFNSLGTIIARNPVNAVLFLILAFFNGAALFLLLKAEFIAMILIIVYVGAVATLFIFSIMMLDVDYSRIREGFSKYWLFVVLTGFMLFAEIAAVVFVAFGTQANFIKPEQTPEPINTAEIGKVLYTDYASLFQISGLILLTAMIGAIVLGVELKKKAKKQDVYKQYSRKNTIELKNPEFNKRVEL